MFEVSGALRRPMDARAALRQALRIVAVAAAALACVPLVLIAELHVPYGWLLESYGLVGFVTAAVGLWLWDRRPSNRTGLLLVVVGLLEIAAAMGNTDNRYLALVGEITAEAAIAALAHLVLAFPTGRLRTRTDRAVVLAHYVVSIGWQVVMYVVGPVSQQAFPRLHVGGHEGWASHANDIQGAMSGLLLVIAAWIVVHRWRTAPFRAQRRPLAAVYAYGIFVLVSFPLTSRVLRPYLHWNVYTLFGLQLLVVLGVPFVYGAALVGGGLARTVEIDELASWLARPDDRRPSLRDALAGALGDPSIQLPYRVGDELVDDHGHAQAPPIDGVHRCAHVVVGPVGDRAAGDRAVIVYDGHLNEPALVAAAGEVVSLAIERAHLLTELVVSREDLRRSRLRLVEQADLERRRLAQDLHDGVQGRLVLAALHAGQLATGDIGEGLGEGLREGAARLRDEIDTAIDELRRLVQGVLPALLIDRGLFVAAEELVDRMPLNARLTAEPGDHELPWPIASTAYFVLAEALANVVKHARAQSVDVELIVRGATLHMTVTDDGIGGAMATGSGLRGNADRLAAVGGRLRITSEPGRGTRVDAELPCGS